MSSQSFLSLSLVFTAHTAHTRISSDRRICPGMYFAMNSIFIQIATMLYVFDIAKCRDPESGAEITPEVDFRGFIR